MHGNAEANKKRAISMFKYINSNPPHRHQYDDKKLSHRHRYDTTGHGDFCLQDWSQNKYGFNEIQEAAW